MYGLSSIMVNGHLGHSVWRCILVCGGICATLCGRIKGKGGDTNLMYPWGGMQIICVLENDANLYIDTTKPLLIVGLNLLIILSL